MQGLYHFLIINDLFKQECINTNLKFILKLFYNCRYLIEVLKIMKIILKKVF